MQKNPIYPIVCLLLCLLLCGAAAVLPTSAAEVHAKAAVLLEAESGRVLYEQHAHTRLPMASTTKIMTALVVLERCDLQATVAIDARAVGVEGSSVYLYAGELLTVEHLLFALLLSSANDAAAALAYEVAGSIEGFAAMMNQTAERIGVRSTHFQNPHGLDADGHYTTAYDLAVITAYALQNEDFLRIVSTRKKVIPLCRQEGARVLYNHNRLLASYPGCIGVKTGFTKKSGRCLVSAAERDGVRLVCVTLNCSDDWNAHKTLMDRGFAACHRVVLTDADAFTATLPVVGGVQTELYLATECAVAVTLPRERGELLCRVEAPHLVYAPVLHGEQIGEAVWTLDGEEIARVPLYAMHGVKKKQVGHTLLDRILELLNRLKELL